MEDRSVFRKFLSRRDGGVAMLFAVTLVPVAFAVGAAVDYSRANAIRTELQRALDAAALAAAEATALTDAERIALGQNFFSTNFPLLNAGAADISIDGNMVAASAQYNLPTSLLAIAGWQHIAVSGVAHALTETQAQVPCAILLDTKGTSLDVNSNSVLDAKCGLHVNSTNKEAIYANSKSKVVASSVCVAGNYKTNSASSITPPPETGCPQIVDPLASLPEPPNANDPCNHNDLTINGGNTTLNPGVYCKKLKVNSKATVTLNPGVYIFKNAEFEINAHSTVTGEGVMLFFSGKDGRLNVNSHSKLQIKAPTSGTYQGIVLFQSRNKVTLETDYFIANSHSSLQLEGTVYMPNGQLKMNSHSTAGTPGSYTVLIARRMELNSHSSFALNTDYGGATPLPPGLSMGGGSGSQGALLVK